MSKAVLNNKIVYQNVYGRVVQHDLYLNQGVKSSDSPTFANIQISGDTVIDGNLYVKGNSTLLDSNVIAFEDNIILVNRNETGYGVTLNQAGFEVDRGQAQNYRMVYQESDGTFRVGYISNLQAVATREDLPMPNGIMTWDSATKRIIATDQIAIDIYLTSTKESTTTTNGALVVPGGIGIGKSLNVGGTLSLWGTGANKTRLYTDTDDLVIESPQDIFLTPSSGNVLIPFNRGLAFGTTQQSISSNSGNNDINISGIGNVNFLLNFGRRLTIPNQVPITFSTPNERVFADGNNNMIITGSNDIQLTPGTNKRVVIPVDTPLTFYNVNQGISANLTSDLSIFAANNILLSPGAGLDIRIPTGNPIKFGGSGDQRIFANASNEIIIQSLGDIFISPTQGSSINIPDTIPINFANTNTYISTSNGNLIVSASSNLICLKNVRFLGTDQATNGSSGSIWTQGGIGVQKTVYSEQSVIVSSTNANAITSQNGSHTVFRVDNSSNAKVSIVAGNGTKTSPALEVTGTTVGTSNYALIQLKSISDTTNGYTLGRGNVSFNGGRAFTVNLPVYADYSSTGATPKFAVVSGDSSTELFSVETETGNVLCKGNLGLTNTQDALNASTASFVLGGGLGVVKSIYTNGKLSVVTDSTQGVIIADGSANNVCVIDTINKATNLYSTVAINSTSGSVFQINNSLIANNQTNTITNNFQNLITNTSDTVDTSSGALVVSGGVGISGGLQVAKKVYVQGGLDMATTTITNLQNPVNPQDAATKFYVDAVKQGLYVKDSVRVGTTTAGNLSSDFSNASVVDGYILQTGDRILIKNQVNPNENGIYIVASSGAPSRSVDMPIGMQSSGTFTFVQTGTINASLGFICNSDVNASVVGTDPINFTEFTGLGQVQAGAGLEKNFNEIYVVVDNSSLEINGDALRIKSSAVSTGLTGGSGSPLQTVSDQSHVTKLGTIDTGVWQASTIAVPYGGTGATQFTSGNLIFGNGTGSLNTNSLLKFDNNNVFFGVGASTPAYPLHVENNNNSTVYINSSTAIPQIKFAQGGTDKGVIACSKNFDDYANNVYPEALVLNNYNSNTNSNIQIATQQQSRITVLYDGNVGINTSIPVSTLHVQGTLHATGNVQLLSTSEATGYTTAALLIAGGTGITKSLWVGGTVHFQNTTPSTSYNNAAVSIAGGLSIECPQNVANVGNGGALTVAGGVSIGGDLYIDGQINGSGSSSSTYAYLTLTATDEAINITTGALVTFGGITIQCNTNATSVTSGGGMLIDGGASIGKDMYIGGDQYNFGSQTFSSSHGNIIVINDVSSQTKSFALVQNTTDGNLQWSRYNSSGNLIENSSSIDLNTGITLFANTTPSNNSSTASLVLSGGLSLNSNLIATSLTSGGGITNYGGQSIIKNLMVGGDTIIYSTTNSTSSSSGALVINGGVGISNDINVSGGLKVSQTSSFNETVHLKGNVLFETVINTSGNALWFYLGKLNDGNAYGYCDIEISDGIQTASLSSTSGMSLRFLASISGTTVSCSHSHVGDINVVQTQIKTYLDPADDSVYAFALCSPQSTTNIKSNGKLNSKFLLAPEGYSSTPNGSVSGFDSLTWQLLYDTTNQSTLKYTTGDLTVEGTNLKINDNIPVIGYNNANTVSSRDIGLLFQRYQISNDTGTGDIVNDVSVLTDSLPNQSGVSSTQVRLSGLASSIDDYYVGWWIRVMSGTAIEQVRKIVAYNGTQHIAELDVAWTNNNPSSGDTVDLYNFQYASLYYTESNKRFRLGFTDSDPSTQFIDTQGDADLQVKGLFVSDTTMSSSASTGSIITQGGITIQNTSDAVNSSVGGSLTTLGGVAINKRLNVGSGIIVGNTVGGSASLAIYQTCASVLLSNPSGAYSFIDFSTVNSASRYGILNDASSNLFSLTYGSDNPFNSSKGITLTSTGNIGINTTNISTTLTLPVSSYISTDSTSGYLGLMSAPSLTGGSSITLFNNGSSSSAGSIVFNTSTTGSIEFAKQKVSVSSNGVVNIFNTTPTTNNSTGALRVLGGVAIGCTQNALGLNNGGALTVSGGATFDKDIFIGGNLYINGTLTANGAAGSPIVTFGSTQNCTIVGSGNVQLLSVSNQGTFSFWVSATPSTASTECSFEFTLPDRISDFTNRGELVGTCTGYTDDTNPIGLFNVLCIGSKNTPNGLIKFQSVSTNIHYFTVLCRYTFA